VAPEKAFYLHRRSRVDGSSKVTRLAANHQVKLQLCAPKNYSPTTHCQIYNPVSRRVMRIQKLLAQEEQTDFDSNQKLLPEQNMKFSCDSKTKKSYLMKIKIYQIIIFLKI